MPDKAGRRDPLSILSITNKEATRHSVPLMWCDKKNTKPRAKYLCQEVELDCGNDRGAY